MESPDPTRLQEKFMHNAFWIAFWIVICVPSAAFSAVAKTTDSDLYVAVAIVMWIGVSLASVAAVVCATVLMIHSRSRRSDEPNGKNPPKPYGKT